MDACRGKHTAGNHVGLSALCFGNKLHDSTLMCFIIHGTIEVSTYLTVC